MPTREAAAFGHDAVGAEHQTAARREILEVCVSGHPLDFLPRNGEVWSDELDGLRGKRVTLCGWVVTYRHVGRVGVETRAMRVTGRVEAGGQINGENMEALMK